MGSYSGCYYIDELEIKEIPVDGEDKTKKGYFNKEGKPVDSYYRFHRVEDGVHYVNVKKENHLVDLIHFTKICNHKFYIEKAIEEKDPSPSLLQGILIEIEEKMQRAQKAIDIFSSNAFNQKVNVHVGGGLITTYNELMLKEDSCTDLIQDSLNAGWWIIAVCAQPDQRRPEPIS